MKDSAVMEIAATELTGAVNHIAQQHNINPTLMRFIMSVVSNKINEMAISELSEEVVGLELKVTESKSKIDKEPIEDKSKNNETKKVSVSSKSKSVRKSGSIQDLIADLKASGVEVKETYVESTKDGTVETVVDEPTGENNEVTK